jgi:hypothetical protein
MYARKLVLLILLVLSMTVVGSGGALAQSTSPVGERIAPQVIDVTFPFEVTPSSGVAGTKTLPAGRYDIVQPNRDLLVFRSAKGAVVEVPVLTRLAKPATPLAEAKVVFDKFGDKYYISEIWIPGEDGFYLGGTREVHTHATVKATTRK